jgi:hypothetical protein
MPAIEDAGATAAIADDISLDCVGVGNLPCSGAVEASTGASHIGSQSHSLPTADSHGIVFFKLIYTTASRMKLFGDLDLQHDLIMQTFKTMIPVHTDEEAAATSATVKLMASSSQIGCVSWPGAEL